MSGFGKNFFFNLKNFPFTDSNFKQTSKTSTVPETGEIYIYSPYTLGSHTPGVTVWQSINWKIGDVIVELFLNVWIISGKDPAVIRPPLCT